MEIAIGLNCYFVKAVSIHFSLGHRLIVSVSHRRLQICDKDNMTRRFYYPIRISNLAARTADPADAAHKPGKIRRHGGLENQNAVSSVALSRP